VKPYLDSTKIFACGVCCFFALDALAQNLETIGKEKPITLSGGVSLNQIFYTVSGIESRRDPYSYYASGNVNISIYGWSVPLSFGISNQNTAFQQPFNQYSIHPTYKSLTGHFGYTSMSYSRYTLNGHLFLGGAVDVAPEGKWKFSAMYGRFLKAIEHDTTNTNSNLPSFRRMGCGFKAGYNTGKDFVDVTLFHAEDEIHSISYLPDSLNILPQENLVVSISAGKSLFTNFLVKAEIASSAISTDTRASATELSNPLAKANFLYKPRLSSSFYKAFKTSFDYQQDFFTVGVAYERIDPQYRTLGAYYFNSDLENITINVSTSILQSKMNISASGGSQHDNLDNSKVSTMRRTVGSLNINYAPSQKLNLSASYSNFQTYTNIRSQFQAINQLTPYENLDTLNFTQLSQNATLTAMYSFGRNENRKQNVNLNITVQDAADKQGDVVQNSGMRFYNFNTAYAMNIVPKNMTVSVSFNASVNDGQGIDTKTYGPVASVNRSFFDRKLRTTLSTSYNNTYSNGVHINKIVNGRFSGTVSLKKKHNINFSTVAVNRENRVEGGRRSFTEFTGTLGYSYGFSK
jgi:hypothetical protein